MGGCIYEAHFECHDILMLGKSPIKWRRRPGMTVAVDREEKHQFKQTNKQFLSFSFLHKSYQINDRNTGNIVAQWYRIGLKSKGFRNSKPTVMTWGTIDSLVVSVSLNKAGL